jgi:hypothetical protein
LPLSVIGRRFLAINEFLRSLAIAMLFLLRRRRLGFSTNR